MRVITFYSYKGGVGRTLAATNFAVYLAKLGQNTAILDFDLEAPGVDSKFPNLTIPEGHKGILDYVLHYQETGSPLASVAEMAVRVPPDSISGSTAPLWLLPAGDYLSSSYHQKLSRLDWGLLFSDQRDGVVFFQGFLNSIATELNADFLIIDSRTGIGEIAGLCTQQLASEVVMLSSLSSESIKVTRHIARLITTSDIARALGKSIDVKIVVSRVPKPEDLELLKVRCCELFEADATKLFFLFSSSALEREEFLALAVPQVDDELVAGYVRLFYGLDVHLAGPSIRARIEKAAAALLSAPPEESERSIMELVVLYPHPDVYRTAMRFFRLINKKRSLRTFAWRLLDFVHNDDEAQRALAQSYFTERWIDDAAKREAVRAIEPLWKRGVLTVNESVRFADVLEDLRRYADALPIAMAASLDEDLDEQTRVNARSIAARCALRAGNRDLAIDLIRSLPQEALTGPLATTAVEVREEAGDVTGALELALQTLRRDLSARLVSIAGRLARKLDRIQDLEDAVRASEDFDPLRSRRSVFSVEARRELIGAMRKAGLTQIARDLIQ